MFMGHSSQQAHPGAELGIPCDEIPNVAEERTGAEATEKPQVRQISCGGTDAF
jgi:hypothetical protein